MGRGKGSGSGRPPKERPKRISGTGYEPNTMEGKAAIKHLKYKRLSADGKTYEIDTGEIRNRINAYIESNKQITDETTGAYTQQPISRVGIRLALDISRDTYSRWLQGYVSANDIDNEEVKCNIELSEAVRAGDDRVLQYLVETCDKYGDTKRIRLLETYGEIGPAQTRAEIHGQINLGKLSKYAK